MVTIKNLIILQEAFLSYPTKRGEKTGKTEYPVKRETCFYFLSRFFRIKHYPRKEEKDTTSERYSR